MPIISLEYHDVVPGGHWDKSGFPGPAAASYKLPTERFIQHLDALATCEGSVGASVRQAFAQSGDGVLLTFDDGGASATTIGRMLAERGWCAHLFITTDQLGQRGFLGREEVADLAKHHVIGSHSASHPTRMSRLTGVQLREEWRRSTGILGDLLGNRVSVASVPGGYYSRRVAEAADEAGIEFLFTSEPVTRIERVGSCAVLGRFTLRREHEAGYVKRLVGRSPLARSTQWMHWNLKKAGKQIAGSAYLRAREVLFSGRQK